VRIDHPSVELASTCSSSNFNLVRRFGAEMVFDYHSPTVAADIRAYTNNELAYVLDCVSLVETTQMCYNAIVRAGGALLLARALPRDRNAAPRPDRGALLANGAGIFGGKVAIDGEYGRDAKPEFRQIGAHAYEVVQALLDRGLIDTHSATIVAGGWENVIRQQVISGYKLVYSLV
jgi:NADPH:quinone reductase-like Zn-dependent oxidoreductase